MGRPKSVNLPLVLCAISDNKADHPPSCCGPQLEGQVTQTAIVHLKTGDVYDNKGAKLGNYNEWRENMKKYKRT